MSGLFASPEHAAVSALLGYLLGSIPFGLIFAWLAGAGDVRKIGSGNIGATNVLRTGNRAAAGATLLFDALKGAASVLIAQRLFGESAALVAAFAAFLGHLFPVWLGFKGGKGGAVALGVLFALDWFAGIGVALTWLGVVAIWRISSLSTLVAAALAPLYLIFLREWDIAALAFLVAILIFVMHRENFRRLLAGTEPRIGEKKA